MPIDRSLLGLETRKEEEDYLLPALKVPGNDDGATADLEKLAEGFLTGKSAKELDDLNSKLTGYVTLIPEPGLCVKMKDKNGKKIFINLCTSDRVPPLPKDVSEEELVEALQSDDVSFRVPMSIGEPHNETDHAGEACVAYEVVINPVLFVKLESSEIFYQFFLSLALEGIENKYKVTIDRDTTIILKGKKFYGTLKEQRIRTKPKMITEVDGEDISVEEENIPLQSENEQPEFKLWLDSETKLLRHCLTAEIRLPNTVRKDQLELFVAENRLLLTSSSTRPKNYRLDILLPVGVVSDDVDAVFDSNSKVLSVTVPLKRK